MIEGAKVYVYKLIVDNGGAPCVADGLLSLAICKPIIRQVAGRGAWIFGFAADSLTTHPNNRLIYAARVRQIVAASVYYDANSPYTGRRDCIYRWTGEHFEIRHDAAYHTDGNALDHDLGSADADTNRGRVLLSDYYMYFGNGGPAPSLEPNDLVRMLLSSLGQGHRVNIGPDLLEALDKLAIDVFKLKGLPSSPAGTEMRCKPNSCDIGLGSNDPEIPARRPNACR